MAVIFGFTSKSAQDRAYLEAVIEGQNYIPPIAVLLVTSSINEAWRSCIYNDYYVAFILPIHDISYSRIMKKCRQWSQKQADYYAYGEIIY